MTKSQELKEKILQNLTDWCFDPLGNLVDAEALMFRTYEDENSYWFRYLKDDEANPNWRTEPKTTSAELSVEDYQEVKEAMINEIKQSSHDWKIEKEGDLTVIKHKSERKHWKSDFSEGFKKGFRENEWKEIENILNNQQQKISPNPSKEQQDNYENWTREQFITEINRLKVEIESLKNNQTLTSSEQQERLQQNQQKLGQLENFIKADNSNTQQPTNNNSLTPLLVFGSILALASLGIYGVVKKSKKVKTSR